MEMENKFDVSIVKTLGAFRLDLDEFGNLTEGYASELMVKTLDLGPSL